MESLKINLIDGGITEKEKFINIINPFIENSIITRIENYEWDSVYDTLEKDDIIKLDILSDRFGTIIKIEENLITIKFLPNENEIKEKQIIINNVHDYKTNKNITLKYPIKIIKNLGYIKINAKFESEENEMYLSVVKNKKFSSKIQKLQNNNIKPFVDSGVIFSKLKESDFSELIKEINTFIDKIDKDYHPFSDNKVLDIVHPSLFPYIKGKTKLKKNLDITNLKQQKTDYWNRKYEKSKYQWLPSEFNIDSNGNCKIDSYINNLPEEETNMKLLIEKLFSKVLPNLELMWSYINSIKLYDDEDTELYNSNHESKYSTMENVTLKNRSLQVITKIVRSELGKDELEGAWHVEGMSHENIVATTVCVLEQTPEFDADLYFKRRFTVAEGELIHNNTGQSRPDYMNDYLGYYSNQDSDTIPGLIPLGKVSTSTGSLTVFPNSHIHKLDLKNNTELGKRTVIVFWLINPDIRIISTKHVARQQLSSSFTLDQAKQHRLELMQERKYHKQNFNVRDLSLCEH